MIMISKASHKSNHFLSDSNAYRPAVMWFWNDVITPEEIEKQITQFHQQKIFEFYIHPMYGMITSYLSEEYFNCIQHAVACAKKLGMFFWIYDEYNWPSGTTGTMLIKQHPEFKNQVIRCPDDSSNAIIQIQNEFTASALWSSFATNEPGYLNTMDQNAVLHFLKFTHEQYKKAIGDEFGKTVKGLFTDEPTMSLVENCKNGQLPYSEELDSVFLEKTGYPVIESVDFFKGDPNQPNNVVYKHAFWKSAAEVFQRCYMKQTADWCKRNHLLYTGHLLGEEYLSTGLMQTGNFFTTSSYFDIPGIDSIFSTKMIDSDRFHLAGRMVASAALFYKKNRILCETFSGSGWQTKMCDLKRVSNQLLIHGINLHLLMGSYYSLKGFRKVFPGGYPPSHGNGNPLFEHYHDYSDYIAVLSQLNATSTQAADVLVLYPFSSAIAQSTPYGRHTWDMNTTLKEDFNFSKIDYTLCGTVNTLIALQIEHNVYPEEYLKEAIVKNGKLYIGECEYHAFILPAVSHIERTTLHIVEQLIEQGGSVLFINDFPKMTVDTGKPITLSRFWSSSTKDFISSMDEITKYDALPQTQIQFHIYKNTSIIISNQLNLNQNTDFIDAMRMFIRNSTVSPIALLPSNVPLLLSRRKYKNNELIFIVNDCDNIVSVPISFQKKVRKILYCDDSSKLLHRTPQQKKRILHVVSIEKTTKFRPRTTKFKFQFHSESMICSLPSFGCMVLLLEDHPVSLFPTITNQVQSPHIKDVFSLDRWQFTPLDENNLRLHFTFVCPPQLSERDSLSFHVINSIFKKGNHKKECDKYTQNESSNPEICHDFVSGSTCYIASATFDVDFLPPDGLYLAIENLDIYAVYINGKRIDDFNTKRIWNSDDRIYDLTSYIQKGKNKLFLVGGIPQWNAPHILPFAVIRGNFSAQNDKISAPVMEHSAFSWTQQGYPYYSGKAKYSTKVCQFTQADRIVLSLSTHDVAEVSVNDHLIKKRCWAPYEYDLTSAWYHDRENEIHVTITSCASNLYSFPTDSGLEKPPVITMCSFPSRDE